jgi:hypothetical protein
VVCAKLFSISAEEAAEVTDLSIPPHIEQEFRVHNCKMELRRRFHNLYQWPAERNTADKDEQGMKSESDKPR